MTHELTSIVNSNEFGVFEKLEKIIKFYNDEVIAKRRNARNTWQP
jgi:hypothetical protein